jgi:ABC-type sugar transport system ATPase subunit
MSMPILEVRNIVKTFPGVKALDNVCFDVKPGEVHAVCGENGAGKSTLMLILAGALKCDSGEILLEGKNIEIHNQKHAKDLGIAMVYQERSLIPMLSVAENIFGGAPPVKKAFNIVDKPKMRAEAKKILNKLDIPLDPNKDVASLTSAMKQMVEIAKALSQNPKVLILDEPTAAITEKEVRTLFDLIRQLRDKGIAIIYISHRLTEIFDIADRVTVLKDGKYVDTANVKEINYDWIVKSMVGRELAFSRVKRDVSSQKIMECNHLTGKGFKDVSFYLKKGEILGFSGLAGAGRTEVMRAIFGADPLKSGEIFIKGKKVQYKDCCHAIDNSIGYLPEDRKESGCFLEMTIGENIVATRLKDITSGIIFDEKKVYSVSEQYGKKLNIITPSMRQKVVNLSGGNQQKVIVAKWIMVDPEILIVDEPTRGIDVGAKAEIYSIIRKLADQGKSIIFISSELPEILSISDRIYVMHEGKIAGELDGDEATEQTVVRIASGL